MAIGYADAANKASLAIHARFGFRQIGFLRQIGFKLGPWTDTVLAPRSTGLGGAAAPDR